MGELTRRYREQLTSLPEQHAITGTSSKRILRILRLAILLTHRRNPALEPEFKLTTDGNNLTLTLSKQWLANNPLTAAELEIESNRQTDIGWPLVIAEQ